MFLSCLDDLWFVGETVHRRHSHITFLFIVFHQESIRCCAHWNPLYEALPTSTTAYVKVEQQEKIIKYLVKIVSYLSPLNTLQYQW